MPIVESYNGYVGFGQPCTHQGGYGARLRAQAAGQRPAPRRKGRHPDPSRTGPLRREYEAALAARFNKVVARVLRMIGQQNELAVNKRFSFTTDAEKVAGFKSWFELELNKALFGKDLSASFDVAAKRFWGNSFANIAYRRGLLKAVSDIRRAGGRVANDYIKNAMARGQHQEVLQRLYTRQYQGLRDISTEVSRQVGETLAKGLSEGKGPDVLARMLADRVEKIGITRARLMARTEIISAYAESELNTFVDAGIQGVELEPELLTAADDRVCDICEEAARRKYTIEGARGVIPLHPNCRCVWAALIVNGKEIELK